VLSLRHVILGTAFSLNFKYVRRYLILVGPTMSLTICPIKVLRVAVSAASPSSQQCTFDFYWKVGSATHQIGLVLGGAACGLFPWVSATCAAIAKLNWRLLGIVQLMLATFFHLSSFFLVRYTEGTEYHWFYASNSLLIAALLLYCLSIVSIFAKYPEPTVGSK
jgi:hypothetical protein